MEITEEMNIHQAWYKDIEDIKDADGLNSFMSKMINYQHDYGTIVHAITSSMLGAMKVINRSPTGGITGFQASCIAWELLKRLMIIEGPAQIFQWDNMLYAQYEDKFDRTIDKDVWAYLQAEATAKLAEGSGHPDCKAHWQTIVDGVVPFGYTVTEE